MTCLEKFLKDHPEYEHRPEAVINDFCPNGETSGIDIPDPDYCEFDETACAKCWSRECPVPEPTTPPSRTAAPVRNSPPVPFGTSRKAKAGVICCRWMWYLICTALISAPKTLPPLSLTGSTASPPPAKFPTCSTPWATSSPVPLTVGQTCCWKCPCTLKKVQKNTVKTTGRRVSPSSAISTAPSAIT